MNEDIPSSKCDPPPSNSVQPEQIEYTRKIPSSEGRLERFFQKVNLFFKRESPPPTPLQGRIHELQANADEAVVHLISAKEDLEKKSDDMAFRVLLNNVLDPFIKEVFRIQRAMDQDSTIAHQVKVSNRYSDWIEKAKWWTETCSQFKSSEAASPVLLAHAVEEFHARIDRDIQVIQDYLNQSIQTLELSASSHKEVERRLSMELGLHLTALQQLKTVPAEETIEAFNVWRIEADDLREKCFSDALHSIDTVSGDINPVQKQSESHEHLEDTYPELRTNIEELENKLALLAAQVEKASQMDKMQKKQCILHLLLLEEEANRLNGDLRLSPGQSDRVQSMLEMLNTFREQIEY